MAFENQSEAGVESTLIRNSKGPLSVTLPDSDFLDCPNCFKPLCSPVYQCENGHIACGSCCTTVLKNKCSNCGLPIGNIRCRAIEMIVESGSVSCQYGLYGCMEKFSYSKKLAHERFCEYASCPCCDYAGKSKPLYNHFVSKHKDSSKKIILHSKISISMDTTQRHVILREGTCGVLFVLYRCIETPGSYFNVCCVAPLASKRRFNYELTASEGGKFIKVKMCVEMMPKWTTQTTANMTFFIPSNFINTTTQMLSLDLIIEKIPSSWVLEFPLEYSLSI